MKRGIRAYFRDQWNVLDAWGLLCLFIGMVFRYHDSTSPWGPAFYALSAPLLVSRVLFFAQILSFQGPMIQASVPFFFYSSEVDGGRSTGSFDASPQLLRHSGGGAFAK